MIELTLADLMAIDYWKSNHLPESRMSSKLGMTYEAYRAAKIPNSLTWAKEIIEEKHGQNFIRCVA